LGLKLLSIRPLVVLEGELFMHRLKSKLWCKILNVYLGDRLHSVWLCDYMKSGRIDVFSETRFCLSLINNFLDRQPPEQLKTVIPKGDNPKRVTRRNSVELGARRVVERPPIIDVGLCELPVL
jgi:hypothetical protein